MTAIAGSKGNAGTELLGYEQQAVLLVRVPWLQSSLMVLPYAYAHHAQLSIELGHTITAKQTSVPPLGTALPLRCDVFLLRAGLSLALGAFLAGLLLAETEYALQVESDIAPYKGLLMGLFFMTVGK